MASGTIALNRVAVVRRRASIGSPLQARALAAWKPKIHQHATVRIALFAEAQAQLAVMKRPVGGFVAEAPSSKLPAWAATAAKPSDAHLAQVAVAAGLTIASFDRSIPGAVNLVASVCD